LTTPRPITGTRMKPTISYYELESFERLAPTQYGSTNEREFFATSFENYVVRGRRGLHPEVGDFFDKLMALARNRWVD